MLIAQFIRRVFTFATYETFDYTLATFGTNQELFKKRNEIEIMAENVKVIVRCRPMSEKERNMRCKVKLLLLLWRKTIQNKTTISKKKY